MPITIQQIPAALVSIGQLEQSCASINTLLNQATILNNENWVVDLGGGVTITVDASQQAALIAQYDTLKASLVTAFNQLP